MDLGSVTFDAPLILIHIFFQFVVAERVLAACLVGCILTIFFERIILEPGILCCLAETCLPGVWLQRQIGQYSISAFFIIYPPFDKIPP